MNRIKVELPAHFHFSTIFTIRISDLNYAGHVGNDSFLSLIHDARERFLKANGYAELSIAGVGLVMADVAIEYKKELHHGDTLKISVAAGGFDKLGFDVFYLLELVAENGETTIAGKAKTGMICYDFTQKKRMPVPQEVATRLNSSVG
jgi:acyl-CoA thioester hydrolase